MATVNSTGLLTGKSIGSVEVTASANDGSGVAGVYSVHIYNYTDIVVDKAHKLVKFYPNPTNGQLILVSEYDNCDYKIYNNIGKIILVGKFSYNTEIDVSNFDSGTYFIEFNQNGVKQTELLIKE